MNEVESTAVTTENWADDVAPTAATAIPTPGAAPSFQTSGDWAAQVDYLFSNIPNRITFHVHFYILIMYLEILQYFTLKRIAV